MVTHRTKFGEDPVYKSHPHLVRATKENYLPMKAEESRMKKSRQAKESSA